VVERVRGVLGRIDLDPASDEFGNTRIMADRYFSKECNGLEQVWNGTIYVNAPGGKTGRKSNVGLFWQKLMQTRSSETLDHAIFMCFSIEAMQSTQIPGPGVGMFPFCVPAKRLRFDGPDGRPGEAPSHSNMIVYVPGRMNRTKAFFNAFKSLGMCR
jgi:hypothetical protein